MPLDHTATLTADYFHRIEKTQATEHISLGGDDGLTFTEPRIVSERFEILNRIAGKRMQLTLYEEGFVRVRKWQRNKLGADYMLSLRFLNPKPRSSRRIARRTMYAAGAFAAFGLFNTLLAALTSLDRLFVPAAVAGFLGAAVALFVFLYRSHEKTRFYTASGNVGVLTLLGTADAFTRCRAIAPRIVEAIEKAQAQNIQNRSDYLRLEMREHYRLRADDAISQDDCATGTRRILSEFG